MSENTSEKKKGKGILGTLLCAVLGAGATALFLQFYCFQNIAGQSMENTYHEGDVVLMKRTDGSDADYGDVVIFRLDEEGKWNAPLIKRVIAKGGDSLDIDFETGEVRRNGELLDEPYIKTPTTLDEDGFTYPITIPDGCLFCMGDNRNDSKDSRSPDVGFVPESAVKGIVKWKLPKWLT